MKKPQVKAVFLDLDGTLMSFATHRVPKSAQEALRRAKEAGVLLFAATGRSPVEIRQIESLPLDVFEGFVSLNGQYCIAGEDVLYKHPVDPDDIRHLIQILEAKPTPCMFVLRDEMFTNFVDDQVRKTHAHINTVVPPVKDPRLTLSEEVFQVVFYGLMATAAPYIEQMPHCFGAASNEMAVDVMPKGGGKATSILHVLEHYGFTKNEALVIGDGDNDVGMLREFPLSVAMATGTEKAREAAAYHCPGPDEDGIAEAFARFVF